jgi:hypothetical protein
VHLINQATNHEAPSLASILARAFALHDAVGELVEVVRLVVFSRVVKRMYKRGVPEAPPKD